MPRQLARCGPDGVAERTPGGTNAACRIDDRERVDEMWGRLWRFDTLFETGRLTTVQRELVDLEQCIQRLPGPLGRWHYLHIAATLAMATARFGEARRLAEESYEVFQVLGHPVAFGACAVVLGQAGMHIGFDASGQTALFESLPPQFAPDVADTTATISSVFPALSMALMALQFGDRAGADAPYGLAGPPASWLPSPALLLSVWAMACRSLSRLDGRRTSSFSPPSSSRSAATTWPTGPVRGCTWAPSSPASARHMPPWAGSIKPSPTWSMPLRRAAPTGRVGYAVEASVDLATALLRRADGAGSAADRAAALLDRAAAGGPPSAMAPYIARIAALRGTGAPTPAAPAATSPASPLTSREADVAALVTRASPTSRSPRRFSSPPGRPRTRIQHILTKLGLANRTQIATWVPPLK